MRITGINRISALLLLALTARMAITPAAETNAQRITFPDARLEVFGLPGFTQEKGAVLRRLPDEFKESVRPPVWSLAQDPSGGRIRFATDSKTIGITAENPGFSNMHHMASVGENGFDLYVDGRYFGSAWPDSAGKIVKEWTIASERKIHEVTIYLPLYKPVSIQEVRLDHEAELRPARPYAVRKPVVYYGSSITQGGCASNAGGSC